MIALTSLISFLVVQLPVLVVLIVGLTLLASPQRRLPGRSHTLARAGLVVLLAQTFAALAWNVAFTQIVARTGWSATQFGLMSSIVGVLLALFFAAGLALLVGAFATIRSASAAPLPHQPGAYQPYQPDSYGPGSVGPDR